MEKFFSIDARTVLTLGRDSIKDRTTALLELVKNSYDADADLVEIEISQNDDVIRIADNGAGMTSSELDTGWLRIGYSSKRTKKLTSGNRRKTGEKGIGRLSADRLGSSLNLISSTSPQKMHGLNINWNSFDVNGKELSKVPIEVVENPKICIPVLKNNKVKNTGTELKISGLRQIWTSEDVRNLYDELSLLTPPFKGVKEDFTISLETDIEGAENFNGIIKSQLIGKALVEVNINLSVKGKVNYSIFENRFNKESKNTKRIKVESGSIPWDQFITKTRGAKEQNRKHKFGETKVILHFFPRKAETVEKMKFSLSELREFLDKNSGIKIYRDKIRVKPYGDPNSTEGDWLGLAERKTRDPAGAGRKSFRVGANQIVGAAFIGRDSNKNLIDSSSREGLVHNDEYFDFKGFVSGSINLLEAHYHSMSKRQKEKKSAPRNVAKDVKSLSKDLNVISKSIKQLTKKARGTVSNDAEEQLDVINLVLESIDDKVKAVEDMANQATIFRGLATLGISTAIFAHETQNALSSLISSVYSAEQFLDKKIPNTEEAKKQVEKSIVASEKISGWGKFALLRVKRDKRRKKEVDVSELLNNVLNELKPALAASNIKLIPQIDKVKGTTFGMDIESVILNLVTNAYTACQLKSSGRSIKVILKNKKNTGVNGLELSVSDSGPGIAKKYKDKIWEPLFTTKVDSKGKEQGTGLGLTIVKSIVDELDGQVEYERDTKLKGAKFVVWLPFI